MYSIIEMIENLKKHLNDYELNDILIEPHIFMILLIIFALSAALFTFSVITKLRPNVTRSILPDPTLPRFRKRDKVMFYGRKMLRKVRTSLQATGRIRGKKRQMVLRFAKRLLRLKRDQPLTLQVKEPSQAFLEEEIGDQCEQPLPPEVIYMLKSIRVFGFFDKPLFLELCKNLEFVNVPKGQHLFSIGDPDDSIFIVQSGRLQVSITESDGNELILKEVSVGESIASMLSVMDVLTGHLAPFKTVSAKAIESSIILRLQVELFKQLLEKYPESLVRVVQVIMVRLQRVTFTALHHYLGLTTQLLNPGIVSTRRTPTNPTLAAHISATSGSSPPKSSPSRPTSFPSLLLQHSHSYTASETSDLKSVLKLMAASDQNQEEDQIDETSNSDHRRKAELDSPRKQRSLNTFVGLPENQKLKRRRSFISSNEDRIQGLTDEEILNIAVEGLMQQLNIDDEKLLHKRLVVREYNSGVCLTCEDTHEENSLFYVLSGSIIVSQKSIDKFEENNLYVVYPGEIVGALSVITGEPSLFTLKTRQSSKVGILTKDHIYDILTEHPKAVLHLAHAVVKRLSTFVRQIDFALDWIHYESGRAIYRQSDKSDCTYIVLSGRLRSVITRSNGKKELVGEYGKGDLVGLVEVITQTPRSTTIMAVRDSELAKLPDGLVEAIKIKYPVVVTRLIHLLGHRILGSLQKPGSQSVSAAEMGSRPTGSNFSTVALLSVTDEVPLQAFTMELYHALTSIGSVSHLTSELIRKTLGPTALEKQSEYRLCSWLAQQEDQHRLVLYQCDSHFSTWTQRCIRQADCILIVAHAHQEPSVGHVEKQLEHLAVRTQKELVLLHKSDSLKPKNTVKWLNIRSWCSSHHHIRCPKRMFTKRSAIKTKEIYASLFTNSPSIHSDFSRLARFLTGTSIGLVLGGGGARGAAHVGMIKAITEAGIPIDMVGGVSIGAFMGALWCLENNITTFTQKARVWSHSMTSYWRQILDLTYPVTAMFTGHAFNRTISEVFDERQIEDLWLPYFTVTTDISSSCPRIHRYGSLWRYIRSSMSLSGYLPPLCDPIDGHLLLDGGYVNNLPADVMREVMGAETILAIDVGSQDDIDMTNYGDTLSGWWLLWKRWNPFSKPVRVPNLPEIQSRLAYVSCVKLLEEVKQSDYCTYIRPPIDKYKTLQFGSFDEIMDVGYSHGKTLFTAMRLDHKSLHSLLHKERNKAHDQQGIQCQNSASFSDLAERVCKIKTPNTNQLNFVAFENISEDEDEVEYVSEPDYQALGTDTDTDSALPLLKQRKVSTMF